MLWFYAALVASLGFAITVLISKSIMKEASSFEFAAIYSLLAPLFLLPTFINQIISSGLGFNLLSIIALIISGLANTAAILASSKAVKEGEVSTVTPLVRTQSIFAAIIGVILLKESMNIQKGLGILLATTGGYIALLRKNKSLLQPIRKLKNSLPAQLGILTALLYATGAIADRYATQTIPPKTYTFLLLSFMAASFTTYITAKNRNKFTKLKTSLKKHKIGYLTVGAVTALAYYSFITALSLAEASKVVPILEIQVLVTVIGGHMIYNEKAFKRKLLGTLILITGITLIAGPKMINQLPIN